MGVGVSQQTPAISFYNVYKIYKEKHRPQPAKPQHVTRGYVAKNCVKCRQELRKIRGRNTSRNGAKCRQQLRNATTKQAPTVWACSCELLPCWLFLFVGFLSVRRFRPFPTVNRCPFRVFVFSERQEPRRLFPFKHC